MRVFDHVDPTALDRRDWQLWVLAIAVILVLASGLALLMYPLVFTQRLALSGLTLHRVFFAFCVLCFLLVGYLMERHLVIRRLRRQLIEEHQRSVGMLEQASADLLETLPGREHIQDRLAMEFRRATKSQQPLSLLVVGLWGSRELLAARAAAAAFGDAAKTLIRRMRREDSIYLLRPGLFGIILPGVGLGEAHRILERLCEGLTDACGAGERFTFDVRVINYPEHGLTAREMEQMALNSFPERGRESSASETVRVPPGN